MMWKSQENEYLGHLHAVLGTFGLGNDTSLSIAVENNLLPWILRYEWLILNAVDCMVTSR